MAVEITSPEATGAYAAVGSAAASTGQNGYELADAMRALLAAGGSGSAWLAPTLGLQPG